MDMTNIWKQIQEDQKNNKDPQEKSDKELINDDEAIEGEVIEDLSEYAVIDRSEEEMPGSMETKPESEDPIDLTYEDKEDQSTYEGIEFVG